MLLLSVLLEKAVAAPLSNPALVPSDATLPGCGFSTGDIHFQCIPLYIGYLIQLVFGFTGGMALTEIIKAGYQIAFSGIPNVGDKEAGKNRLRAAIVGFALSVLAFALVDMIVSIALT